MRVAMLALVLVASASQVWAQICGDASGDGRVTVSDGVAVLRAGAGLSTACTPAVCDVDGSGTVSVTDGVLVLRKAADLPTELACHIDAREACLATIRAGDLAASVDTCGTAAAADPSDATVRAMADASSAVVATLTAPELTGIIDGLGFVREASAANVCHLLVHRHRGSLPPDAPRTGAIVAALRGRGLELIDQLLASGAEVPTDATFHFSCPELAEETIVVEIDYGDLLVARYELELYAALIHVATAYDVDFDVDATLNGHLRFRDVFIGNPALFTLDGGRGAAELGLARMRLDAALESYVAAIDFITSETDDQSDDLFVIGPGDVATAARERVGALRLRTALNGTARFEASTFDLASDQRLTLDRFFDGAIANVRALLPGFDQNGDANLCDVGDPTFGGILPDLETNAITGCLEPKRVDFVGGHFGPLMPVLK